LLKSRVGENLKNLYPFFSIDESLRKIPSPEVYDNPFGKLYQSIKNNLFHLKNCV
jgi:hypothetical protein